MRMSASILDLIACLWCLMQVRRLLLLNNLSHDIRYAIRALRTSPGFSAVAILREMASREHSVCTTSAVSCSSR